MPILIIPIMKHRIMGRIVNNEKKGALRVLNYYPICLHRQRKPQEQVKFTCLENRHFKTETSE